MATSENDSRKKTTKRATTKTTTKKTSSNKKTTTKISNTKRKIEPKTVKTTNITKQKVETPKKVVKEIERENETNVILTVIGIIVLVIAAVVIFRLTYAFFTAYIDDKNKDNTDVVIEAADLLVRYADNQTILETKMEPGESFSKEFWVQNDGNDTGYYAIVLDNLTNTFDVICPTEENKDNGEIVFYLYKYNLDENGNKTADTNLMSTGVIPCVDASTTGSNYFTLYDNNGLGDAVEVTKTNYYNLKIEYKNLDIDQSDNMDTGKLEARINIKQADEEKRTAN